MSAGRTEATGPGRDREPDAYLVERVHRALATDPRVAEPSLEVEVSGDRLFVSGAVSTKERQEAVTEVVRETAPGLAIRNETSVAPAPGPPVHEEIT